MLVEQNAIKDEPFYTTGGHVLGLKGTVWGIWALRRVVVVKW